VVFISLSIITCRGSAGKLAMRYQWGMTRYQFLIDTYETEIVKTVSVWSMFDDGDLARRPRESDARGRSVVEQMIHQCISEDGWFKKMLGIEVTASPVPAKETRLDFIRTYARDGLKRLAALAHKDEAWWEATQPFFDVPRSRAWIMTRRLTHSAHHRGQQTALLRMLGHDLHSTYGPTADTGGLPANGARTIYAYAGLQETVDGGSKARLPGTGERAPTERPPD
jgi:uncharacterized damage-inducible protein DinB